MPRTRDILLAEDEDGLLRALTRILEGAGYKVATASDGSRALAQVQERRFDVIVSDIAMPGATGLALLKAVRQRGLDTPVVLMTGSPTIASAVEAVEFGALRYLVKPFDPADFLEAVGKAARIGEVAQLRRQAAELLDAASHGLGDTSDLPERFERALATLRVVYQPIVWARERKVFGFEALVRSGEPTLGNPMSFISAAERLGRLHDLGRAIRRTVAAGARNAPAGLVLVNLHSQDLLDDELFAVSSPLSAEAGHVVLEITERASLDGLGDVQPRIAALRKLGFRIAVDDLGAGYAGLTTVIQLMPEVVKFDMTFVRGIDSDSARLRILTAMTEAFRDLKVTTVAEGVETLAERAALLTSGCDTLQGYLFAKPGPAFPEITWP